ncbi:PucR family transcriptional regulator [Nocardia brasiliensis]|uniref:PucR family transcriptional regulator n=1 Tax=Nocardia brasiliensis TaxID=37326 RepID=UPI001895F244|nr:PucR family transcriptional regulator [Nocardia brasiliensis]MBF6541561.1 PucR family transcriptional regulator ligand-binding domain-containing protein [Nocardia brasiliensis]
MAVPISWVLSQADLALRLRGGAGGVGREVDLVLTTELEDPFPWLSHGELVLTTGMRLPRTSRERAAYLRAFDDCGVAAVGFGTGLTYAEVPADLIAAADAIGIPLLEVPLPTPFAAVVKKVSARVAELQYDALLRASRAQPRMTKALLKSGARAIVRELAGSLAATVLIVDAAGTVTECHPEAPSDALLRAVRAALAADPAAAASSVRTDTSGASITHQRIGVDRRSFGELVVVSAAPLSGVDQILLGHANSLLALDFAKPVRLQAAQQQLNSQALALVLSAETDLAPAWAQLLPILDAHGRIRVLVAECDSAATMSDVRDVVAAALHDAGHPVFLHAADQRVSVLLPGSEGVSFARRLALEIGSSAGILTRIGLSGGHRLRDLGVAAENATRAASVAERGGAPVEFDAMTGRSLLAFDATRQVLDAMADTVLTPLVEHDRSNGTDLLNALHTFLEANGQWESAAATLGVHRHTLRKRIAFVEDLLACDLDNARVRAELLLAILVRRT